MNGSGAASLHLPPSAQSAAAPEELQVVWGFVTLMTPHGMILTTDDPSMLADKIKVVRQPTQDEISGACAVTREDIQAQKTAAQVHHGMMAAARASQDQALTQQIMNDIGMPGR
ncbi:hypothetical protein ACIBCT_35455 [Streptosporangium sp. NPDC050855]|uniref:hypothetical protein n=1 Tax=Streptosporangium sp. NPDC050855 TaxID=3366194 RepID=UPI00378C4433